jgi:hypothetical protein
LKRGRGFITNASKSGAGRKKWRKNMTVNDRYLIIDTHTGTCYEFEYERLEDAVDSAKSLLKKNFNIKKLEIVSVAAVVMARYDFDVYVSEKEGLWERCI